MLDIYIEDLSAKLEGYSVGKWITLPMEKEEFRAEIFKILEEGERLSNYDDIHEEWEIEDWEWNEEVPEMFEPDIRGNGFDINRDIALIKEKVAPAEYKIFKFLIEEGYDLDEAMEKMDEVVLYEDSTLEDVARAKFDDYFGLETDDTITRYLDFEEWGDDLRLDDYRQVGNDVFAY